MSALTGPSRSATTSPIGTNSPRLDCMALFSPNQFAPPASRNAISAKKPPANPANFMKSVLVVWVTVLQQRKASDVLYI